MTILVGLAGPQQGGKDTIANGLADIFHLDKRRFAEKLYAMAAIIDPVFRPEMKHSDKEDWVLGDPSLGTRRAFLEKLGTEFGRNMIHQEIWSKTLIKAVRRWPTVVADVRFESEAAAIREAGGTIIHLRPNWTDYGREHPSDHPLEIAAGDLLLASEEGKKEETIQAAADHVAEFFRGKA